MPPTPEPVMGNDDQQILSALAGLKVVDSPALFMTQGAMAMGVTIENLPLLDAPELRAQLMTFIGKPLTFGDLKQIQQVIVAWYAAHDRPFVDVVFPEQDITIGVVQAIVTEFHAGEIRVQGNRWFSSPLLLSEVRLHMGDTIDARRLTEDLDWINQNPFRTVSMVAQRSAIPGDTDLVLQTQDRFPVRFYGGYDNYNTVALGTDRWNVGVNWGNASFLDHQLSYQFTASNDFFNNPGSATFIAHSLNYLAPLPWRDKLSVFGAYSQARPLLGPDLGELGITGQASARYVHTLPSLDLPALGMAARLIEDVEAGYDFKNTNNNLSFGGQSVSNVTTEIDQFPLIYDAVLASAYGQMTLSNTFVWSPGNLTAANRDSLFQAQANTPFASAHYVYDTLSIVQTTRLPFDASWIMRVTGQVANHNLLPSEELGAGGHDSVRGYSERVGNGSEGVILTEELRTPLFSVAAPWLPAGVVDQAQLLVFWDYGSVLDVHHTPKTPESAQLASVGPGLRYTVSRFLDFRFDYGWQLRHVPGAAKLDQMAQFSVTLSD